MSTSTTPSSPVGSTASNGAPSTPDADALSLQPHSGSDKASESSVPLDRLADATAIVDGILERAKTDCGAPFERESIKALAFIRNSNPANYQRVRSRLKKANKDVSVAELDAATKANTTPDAVAQTHHGYANDLISTLTIGEWAPIGHVGTLYAVNPIDNIWVQHPIQNLERMAAERHDGKENCVRRTDYSGIAQHVITLATNDAFFPKAPVGLACPDGFYQIVGNGITIQPLTPHHRQRVKLDFTPKEQATPLFDKFLGETFHSASPGEEEQQLTLVQEIAGAITIGIMARYQKAVHFYDPFGRAGKGTLERILRRLVPPEFVTAISPFVWDREYYVASLAGIRLNVVGELSDFEPIPAAVFKTVIGGDLLTGRHPTHRPISFTNEAAHLFMSNHMINTRDHSEAFFSRWLLIEFPNSRLRSGLPLDPTLPVRIIEHELPGIAYWAMSGAARLLRNGKFSKSLAHNRLMAQWRRSSNSLEEFIHERCALGSGFLTRRSEFYAEYANWCSESGRRAFAKGRVKDLLAHNVGLGILLTKIDGYETFRGVRVFPDSVSADDRF